MSHAQHIYHVSKPQLASPLDGIATDVTTAVTSTSVMERAKLDWRVTENPLFLTDGTPVDTHKALLRNDTNQLLGVVGDGFEVLQNAEAFAFCDSLVAKGKVEYMSAGQFRDGKRIFIQGRINRDEPTEIAPGSFIEPYFLLANSHDGSLAVRALTTPIVVVCQNTFQRVCSKKGTENNFRIKHTKNMQERLAAAQVMFGALNDEFDQFSLQAKTLVKKQFSSSQRLKQFFRESFAVADTVSDVLDGTRAQVREDRLSELFLDGAGMQEATIRGSAWAAVNAVTQYLTHEAGTSLRGIDLEGTGPDEKLRLQKMKRFESNVLGNNAKISGRAFDLALAL